MTGESRPLLAFNAPIVVDRPKQKSRDMPRLSKPSARRQGERLTPQFRELINAFEAERARLAANTSDEVDPALVVVFDLAGSVKDFRNAINQIDGLEFLSELIGDPVDPDDDFHMTDGKGPINARVPHSLYLMMSNVKAVNELLRLFALSRQDPSMKFERGLGKFKAAFEQLATIRRWGPEDRIRETGLLENWQETIEVVGQSLSRVIVEIELWYRRGADERAAAESHVERVVANSGGKVLDRCQIGDIGYHALLAELPVQHVQSVLSVGAASVQLLTTDEVMFVSPFTPMSVAPAALDPATKVQMPSGGRVEGFPRIALLDGLPFQNHDALAGRLVIDDPDGVDQNYPVSARTTAPQWPR